MEMTTKEYIGYNTNTDLFRFVVIDLYNRPPFEEAEIPDYMEMDNFDMDGFRNCLVPYVQEAANDALNVLKKYVKIESIKVLSIDSPREYNFGTDWANLYVEFKPGFEEDLIKILPKLKEDEDIEQLAREVYRTHSGFMSFGPENWEELERGIKRYDEYSIMETLTFILLYDCSWDADELFMYYMNEIEGDYRVEDFASFTSCIPEGCERIYDDWCSDAQDMFYNAVREQYPEYIAAKEERGDKGNHLLTLMKWMKGKGLDVENVKLWRKI